jgi:PAS domain-containing protein
LPAHLETLDHLATMVSVVTPEGLCLFANTAFEEALGLSQARHAGHVDVRLAGGREPAA